MNVEKMSPRSVRIRVTLPKEMWDHFEAFRAARYPTMSQDAFFEFVIKFGVDYWTMLDDGVGRIKRSA